jgi:hypothetical protein
MALHDVKNYINVCVFLCDLHLCWSCFTHDEITLHGCTFTFEMYIFLLYTCASKIFYTYLLPCFLLDNKKKIVL